MTRRKRKVYTEEFKLQMVNLYLNGKKQSEISKEFDLTLSALRNWIIQHENSGSFKAKDNRSSEDNRLLELEKENKQLRMENDL